MARLTRRRAAFVREYVKDFNGMRAAIRAGYAPASANVEGARLLADASVKEQLEKLIAKSEVTAEKVLRELACMGFSNMQDYIRVQDGEAYVDLSQLTREQAAAIQEITVEEYTEGRGEEKRDIKRVKFKLHDKKSPLELLGKNLKLFAERLEHTGSAGGPIQIKTINDFYTNVVKTEK